MANDVTLNTHAIPRPRASTSGPDRYLRVQHSQPAPGLHVCVVIGDIDLYTLPVLETALSTAERPAARTLVVDLSRVEFLAACGVGALLAAAHRADQHGWRFALVVNTTLVRRVLDLTEGSRQLASYGTLSDVVG